MKLILILTIISSYLIIHQAQIDYPTPLFPEREPVKRIMIEMIENAGLNTEEAFAIITCESSWNKDALRFESNGTISVGYWQINSIHKVLLSCATNPICSTEWAIQKRLREGNYSAWTCSK